MTTLGKIEEFDVRSGKIDRYLERLEQYFEANKIPSDSKPGAGDQQPAYSNPLERTGTENESCTDVPITTTSGQSNSQLTELLYLMRILQLYHSFLACFLEVFNIQAQLVCLLPCTKLSIQLKVLTLQYQQWRS